MAAPGDYEYLPVDICPTCGELMFAKRIWLQMTDEEKRASGGRYRWGDACKRCTQRERRPVRKTWKLEDLIEEAEFLISTGSSVDDVASRLGLKYNSLVKSYQRARKKGLTTRKLIHRYERKKAA